jgi:AraC-like DNA-binding protein
LLNWRLPPAFHQAVLAGEVVLETNEDREALDRALFRSWFREMNGGKRGVSRWMLLEIEARLGRLGETREAVPAVDSRRVSNPLQRQAVVASRVALFLSEHYAENLHWEEVARATGVSAAPARKCFQRAYGVTPHQYLVHLRLAHARQLIAQDHSRILDIALETGFPTVSNFYRCFEAEVGQTPSAYRKSLRSF